MLGMRTLDRHAALVEAMAARHGIDLSRAMAEGRLSAEAARAMVLRCTGCRHAGACRALLDSRYSSAGAPAFCRNRAAFDAARGC